MNFEPNEEGIRRMTEQICQRVQAIVNDTVQETRDDDLDTAVDTLHQRLNAVGGLYFDRDWAQNTVVTLRRGDSLQITIQ